MEELALFPSTTGDSLQLIFLALDEATFDYAFRCLQQMRRAGIAAELYPEPAKMKKQMKYANARQAPYVVIIGSEEMNSGRLALKNMVSGEQQQLELERIIELIQE